jgi:hypothetical protein
MKKTICQEAVTSSLRAGGLSTILGTEVHDDIFMPNL